MKRLVAHYAFCHFAVDLSCIATLLMALAPYFSGGVFISSALVILAYDLLAFCLQLPLGAALDRIGHMPRAALLSFALVAAGAGLSLVETSVALIASLGLISLGNALFHCAGGIDVLGISEEKATPSGLFISTGALGVFLGGMAANSIDDILQPALIVLMAICAVLILWLGETPAERKRSELGPATLPQLDKRALVAIVLITTTVGLRSYTGMVMNFPWKIEFALAVLAVLAIVAGKALGGLAADASSLLITSVFSLGGAAFLFLFSFSHFWAGLTATLLFNFTMPITLISLAKLLPNNHGLAFGMASFALAIGALPALFGFKEGSALLLSVLSLVSLCALSFGVILAKDTKVQ